MPQRGLLIAICLVLSAIVNVTSAQTDDTSAVREAAQWLKKSVADRGPIEEQAWANKALSQKEAVAVRKLLWADYAERTKADRAEEIKAKTVIVGDHEMKYDFKVFGKKPRQGRSLYISMHGGGGAPKRVNDGQWENQKILYSPKEGVYLAPRAPTDSWNMWHQGYMDPMLDQLITDLTLTQDVDPNRVYLMGYSAGGDGVYQLAPRMADRFAAAAMMAGHPNEASPLGLRNLPFALYCGGKDSAYDRNKIAKQWGEKLDALAKEDDGGYVHRVKIYPNKGHWMDREDAEAVPWMAEFKRDYTPKRVVWRQDDVTNARFYWLAVPKDQAKAGQEIVVERDGQTITIESLPEAIDLHLRLRDDMLDLDSAFQVKYGDATLFSGKAIRTAATIAKTIAERGDPTAIFDAEISLTTESGAQTGESK